jgi:hypothetical protein
MSLKLSGYYMGQLLYHQITLHFVHRLCLCVPRGSYNEQRYFPNINRWDFVTEMQYVYYKVENEFLCII